MNWRGDICGTLSHGFLFSWMVCNQHPSVSGAGGVKPEAKWFGLSAVLCSINKRLFWNYGRKTYPVFFFSVLGMQKKTANSVTNYTSSSSLSNANTLFLYAKSRSMQQVHPYRLTFSCWYNAYMQQCGRLTPGCHINIMGLRAHSLHAASTLTKLPSPSTDQELVGHTSDDVAAVSANSNGRIIHLPAKSSV